VLLLGLLVIQDTIRGRENQETELTRGQQVVGPLLDLADGNVEARRDDGALVKATKEVNNDLTSAVVVNNFELTDVTCDKQRGKKSANEKRRNFLLPLRFGIIGI
jgi:hypothetical protein